jgi:hypothetical protein
MVIMRENSGALQDLYPHFYNYISIVNCVSLVLYHNMHTMPCLHRNSAEINVSLCKYVPEKRGKYCKFYAKYSSSNQEEAHRDLP